jgi:hypothetical protein
VISNLRILLATLFIFCGAGHGFIYSQSAEYFDGKILNLTNSKPVPFATIKLKNNQLGVYANANGDFKVARNKEFQDDSLLITCIGFKQYSIAYKDLTENSINRIFLTPVVYGLGEVKIVASGKKLGSLAIIGRAIRNIKNNYPYIPYNYISYYRDYQKRDGNYINLNEAIVQTLENGFSSEEVLNKYRLLDFRKNMDFPRMNISPYYESYHSSDKNNSDKYIPAAKLGDQYGNELFVLMVHDAIRNFKTRSFSFIDIFSENFIQNHTFSEPTPVYNNNLLLFKITFTGKSRVVGDSLLISGAIYIQPKYYSIHKLEYSCSYKTKGQKSKEMFNVDIEYGQENAVDSLMCLKYISFNNYFKVMDSDDDTYFKVLDSYLDTHSNIKSTVCLHFNNKIDPSSASKKNNYEIIVGKKPVKISSLQVNGKYLYIRLKDEDLKDSRDSIKVIVRDISDINGNIIDKRKSIDLYQYRELFVQEYNKSLPLKDSCYMQYLPLEQNCISKYSGNANYWMNTPENIKNIK